MKNIKLRWRITKLAGKLSRKTKPYWLIKCFIKLYIKFFSVDLSDTEFQLKKGMSFHDFFTRPLKLSPKIFQSNIVSPTDGRITSYGLNNNDRLIQAKGISFSFKELTQSNFNSENISYAVFYLSPADYHRFHAPFNIHIKQMISVGGTCFSVNQKSVSKRKDLYCRNERVVLKGDSEFGKFWIVLVGAMIVGSVHLSFTEECLKLDNLKEIECNYELKIGDEIGYFALGSTVIICLDSPILANIPFYINQKVKMGDSLIAI